MGSYCEKVNEPSGSVKCGEFLTITGRTAPGSELAVTLVSIMWFAMTCRTVNTFWVLNF